MGNLLAKNSNVPQYTSINIEGQQIKLSPLITEIHAANEELLYDILPYYNGDTSEIEFKIYMYFDGDMLIATDKKNIRNDKNIFLATYIFKNKKYFNVSFRMWKRKFIREKINEPSKKHEFCEIRHIIYFRNLRNNLLYLLSKNLHMAECEVLYRLLKCVKKLQN